MAGISPVDSDLPSASLRGNAESPDRLVAAVLRSAWIAAVGSTAAALALLAFGLVCVPDLGPAAWIWLAACLAVLVERGLFVRRYRTTPDAASGTEWLSHFHRSVCLNGIVWGAAGFVFGNHGDVVLALVTFITLCGLFAGTVGTYFMYPRAVFLFAVPALVPYAAYLITRPELVYSTAGGLMLAFMGIMSVVILQVSESLDSVGNINDTRRGERNASDRSASARKQVEHLYKTIYLTAAGSVLGAAAVILLLRDQVQLAAAATWFGAVACAAALRIYKAEVFRRGVSKQPRPGYWLTNFNYPLALLGIVWTTGAIVLPQNDFGYMLMMVAIQGIVSGAVAAFSSHTSSVLSLVVPAVLPYALFLSMRGDDLGTGLAAALIVFSAILVVAGSRIGHLVRTGFFHEVENDRLVDALRASKGKVEELNRDLEMRVRQRTDELDILVAELRGRSNELVASRKQYRDIVEQTHELIHSVGPDGSLKFANGPWKRTMGYDDTDIDAGVNVFDLIAPESREHCRGVFANLSKGIDIDSVEFTMLAKDGSRRDLSGSIHSALGDENEPQTFGIFSDVSAARAADAALKSSEARFRAIFSRGSISMLIIDESLAIIEANEHASKALRQVVPRLDGSPLTELVLEPGQSAILEASQKLFSGQGDASTLECELRHEGDATVWMQFDLVAIRDAEDRVQYVAVILSDISERKAVAEVLEYHARHDYLTGLLNRRAFENELESAMHDAAPTTPVGLIYVDLDRFKLVDDTYGHRAGDELLIGLSRDLAASIPEDCSLARISGDEFGIIVPSASVGEAHVIARSVINAIQRFRFEFGQRVHAVDACAGIAMIARADTLLEAMQAANAACKAAKARGQGRIEIYDVNRIDMRVQRDQVRAASVLANALKEDRLQLFVQPIQSIRGDRESAHHYEVLLRVTEDSGAVIGPGDLLIAAEKYGYAADIDRWVFDETVKQLRAAAPGACENLRLSVNLSTQSLLDEAFEQHVAEQLSPGALGSFICFEITESRLISNFERATAFISRLRRIGCRFSLDDFGTGFASYGYLKTLGVDSLKVDGTFIRNITEDAVDEAIVRSIAGVAHALGIETIAEYVESNAHVEALRRLGIDRVQGYAIGRPEPMSNLLAPSRPTLKVLQG